MSSRLVDPVDPTANFEVEKFRVDHAAGGVQVESALGISLLGKLAGPIPESAQLGDPIVVSGHTGPPPPHRRSGRRCPWRWLGGLGTGPVPLPSGRRLAHLPVLPSPDATSANGPSLVGRNLAGAVQGHDGSLGDTLGGEAILGQQFCLGPVRK